MSGSFTIIAAMKYREDQATHEENKLRTSQAALKARLQAECNNQNAQQSTNYDPKWCGPARNR